MNVPLITRILALSSQSIGIIGGADGPTAIFVSGDPVRLIVGILIVAAGFIGLAIYEKRKK
jgi:Na+-transporting methylmalonyl-CoA/oxaloacetate decarboxylase beta subunit